MKHKKRLYKAVGISQVNVKRLAQQVDGQDILIGIDIAKRKQFCAIANRQAEIFLTIKFDLNSEFRRCLQLFSQLPASSVEIAMEPTGTYGDAMRALFLEHDFPVYRVTPKKVFDSKEIYDGVPSNHDAKSAALIVTLHSQGHSSLWPMLEDSLRELNGTYNVMKLFAQQEQHHVNNLEAALARHWPEVTDLLELKRASLLELLEKFGSPQEIARNSSEAKALLEKVGGHFLTSDKIAEVMRSAERTIGVKMLEGERQFVMTLASELRRVQKCGAQMQKKLEALGQQNESVLNCSRVVGKKTAAIVVLKGGDPRDYDSVGSYLKALGLNLSVFSSGESKRGRPHISKRGNSVVRKYLFMCVLRWIREEEGSWARVWYEAKLEREGGKNRMKALVALMRKLAKGLWHVARGEVWDESKLFDVKKLEEFQQKRSKKKARGKKETKARKLEATKESKELRQKVTKESEELRQKVTKESEELRLEVTKESEELWLDVASTL